MFTTYFTNYFFTLSYDFSCALGFSAFEIFISLGCKRFCQKTWFIGWLLTFVVSLPWSVFIILLGRLLIFFLCMHWLPNVRIDYRMYALIAECLSLYLFFWCTHCFRMYALSAECISLMYDHFAECIAGMYYCNFSDRCLLSIGFILCSASLCRWLIGIIAEVLKVYSDY